MWQISNSPANGARLGSYLSKNGCFWAKTGKMGPIKTALAPKPANFFDKVTIFELLGDDVKFLHHMRVCVDFFFKLILLPPCLLHSQGD